MKRLLAEMLLVALFLCPAARGQDTSAAEEALEDELSSQEEDDISMFVTPEEEEIDIFDEFALLEDEIAQDEVESASKHRQSIFWSPSAITVLTREDIQASGAITLADLLRRVPGIDVYEIKPSYPVVGARALTEESNNLVLTLIDGKEAIIEFAGFTFWNVLYIDLEEIKRIEVIRGPGSALYGANAYAAVVSITTIGDRPTKEVKAALSGGEQGQFRFFGRLEHYFDLGDGTLDFGVTLGSEGRDSSSDRWDELLRLRVRSHGYVRYRIGHRLDVSLQYCAMHGTGPFFTHIGDLETDPSRFHSEMLKAEFALSEKTRLKLQFYYDNYSVDFFPRTRYRAYDMWVFDFPDVTFKTDTVDGQVQFDWEAGKNFLLIAGGNVRYTATDWVNLIISDGDDLRAATFLHLQWNPWDSLQFTGGLRVDLAPEAEERLALSPRGVVVYRPWDNHAFRLGYGLVFRKPSIYESRTHAKISVFNPATSEIVDKLAEQFGNESLRNEKVHSIETGYQTRLLEEKLQLSLDLYYNIYQESVTFVIDIPTRLGLPDVPNSTIQYQNVDDDISALGGEFELTWHFAEGCSVWGNLGLRKATETNKGGDRRDRAQEPTLRANLGLSYFPESGFVMDLALHYVSEYKMPLLNPANLLNEPELMPLGDDFLLIGRVGYRAQLGRDQHVEGGLTIRAPLGKDFREYAGIPLRPSQQTDTASDFGGGVLVRIISFYLRGAF